MKILHSYILWRLLNPSVKLFHIDGSEIGSGGGGGGAGSQAETKRAKAKSISTRIFIWYYRSVGVSIPKTYLPL